MASIKIGSDLRKEENLSAVVVTDSFDHKFEILTEEKPKCLLPLANKEMIDYTLEFLQSSGVQDCYVYSARFITQIKRHLSQRQWVSSTSQQQQLRNKMNVTIIADEYCHSFGGAMRALDGKGLLRDHFILTTADVISNVNLKPIVQEHRRRYKDDKNTTMTLIYKQTDPGHHTRTNENEVLLLTRGENNQILYYSRTEGSHKKRASAKKTVQFPTELFQNSSNHGVNIRFDLADTGIAICSPSVPLQFAENFDCQTLDNFVKGSLEDDIADNFLYAYILGDTKQGVTLDGYAAKVTDFLTYLSVATDILNRWTYPFVPETSRDPVGRKLYSMSRHNVYKVRL